MSGTGSKSIESNSAGSSKKSSSVSPAREYQKLTTSLALAGTANKKSRPKSHSPTSRKAGIRPPQGHLRALEVPEVLAPVLAAILHPNIPTNIPEEEPEEERQGPLLKEEYIHSYDYFHYRIPILYRIATHSTVAERVIVLFTANDLDSDQSSTKNTGTWCKECNYLETLIAKFKSPKHQGGYLIRVKVGTWEDWMSPSNPYRLDKNTRLKSIPTIMVWGTSERLAGKDIFDVNQLVAIFDESIKGDPWRSSKYRSAGSSKSLSNRFEL